MGQLLDKFTGTAGTLLSAHTSDSGHTWTKVTAQSSDTNIALDTYNRARTVAGGNSLYLSSFIPANFNYDIEVDFANGDGNMMAVLHNWSGANNDNLANGFLLGAIFDATQGHYGNGAAFGYPVPPFGFPQAGGTKYFTPPPNGLETFLLPGVLLGKYKLQRRGSTWRMWINGRLMGSGTEQFGHGGTRVGLYAQSNVGAFDNLLVRDLNGALTAGRLTLGWPKPGKICVYYHDSEGGTAPYTTTLHAATNVDFVPGPSNQIGTFDSSLLIEWAGAVAGTVYDLKVKTTDNVGATAVSATTAAASAYLPAMRVERSITLWGCGDSLTHLDGLSNDDGAGGYWRIPQSPERIDGSWPSFSRAVRALTTQAHVTIPYNQEFAVGGSKSSDWLPASSNLNALNQIAGAYDADTRYTPTGSESWTILQLGANDAFPTAAVTPATFLANITSIVNDQLARGRRVFVVPTSFLAPDPGNAGWWNETSDTLIQQYATQLATLDNGTTVRVADLTLLRRKFAARHLEWLTSDGTNLHYNDAGMEAWGTIVAYEFARLTGLNTLSIEQKIDAVLAEFPDNFSLLGINNVGVIAGVTEVGHVIQVDSVGPGAIVSGSFDEGALAAIAGMGFVVTPLQAVATNPRYATRDLPPIAQGSAPAEIWVFTDATGAAVNLSGKALRFVAYRRDDNGTDTTILDDVVTGAFKYETGDGITIGGTSNNQVTVQHSATKTATAGDYNYFLWNVTDNIVLAKGKLPIEPAVKDVA